MQQKPRQIAARILFDWESGTGFAENIMRQALTGSKLKAIDRHLVQEMVYGVARNLMLLDTWIDEKSNQPPGKTRARNMLRLGLYQLAFMDRIPDHAAVHETVATARQLGLNTQAGFINAILRGFLRQKKRHLEDLAQWKTTQPHLAWSHPEWLVRSWNQAFGKENTAQLLEWNNTIPEVYARWNPLKGSLDQLESMWDEEKVVRKNASFPWTEGMHLFKILSFPSSPEKLDSFQKGLFYIQDPSTLLAVKMMDAQPEMNILDYCAAPGGKTSAMAASMKQTGHILATDPDPGRLRRLKDNLYRLGVQNADMAENPETDSAQEDKRYDAILVDAPCSNTGVMRRRLDVRWRLTEDEIRTITEQQAGILQQASTYLKPGGKIVYSTCSLEAEENGAIVSQFLKDNPAFKLTDQQQLTPFEDGVDGAYAATLKKAQ
jgi:16S rRNA (cytosine967-C5)-methyltransferase